MLNLGGSDHPPFTDIMLGASWFYDSYPPDEALSVLHRLGFEPLVAEIINEPTTSRDKGGYATVAQLAGKPFNRDNRAARCTRTNSYEGTHFSGTGQLPQDEVLDLETRKLGCAHQTYKPEVTELRTGLLSSRSKPKQKS